MHVQPMMCGPGAVNATCTARLTAETGWERGRKLQIIICNDVA